MPNAERAKGPRFAGINPMDERAGASRCRASLDLRGQTTSSLVRTDRTNSFDLQANAPIMFVARFVQLRPWDIAQR